MQDYGAGMFASTTTKTALKKVLKKRLITVNGVVASTATFLEGGETIVLSSAEKAGPSKRLDLNLKVLYQDQYLAAIYKPAGILVSGNSFKTVTNALAQNLEPSTLNDATAPWPVHRLDYATTGILLVGKTNEAIRRLNQMFEVKSIAKTYFAVTMGQMNDKGVINTPIDGKEALTRFTKVVSVESKRFTWLNLVKLTPETGRRHQLRIHLSGIGNPILGDKDYGIQSLVLMGKGMYLHAASLEFDHPFTNENIVLHNDIPLRFKQ